MVADRFASSNLASRDPWIWQVHGVGELKRLQQVGWLLALEDSGYFKLLLG